MTTANFSLPEGALEYVDTQVKSGAYPSASDYLGELILRDKQAAEEFRALIVEGINSGQGEAWHPGKYREQFEMFVAASKNA
jgi:antitoxin ParD1/3/4